MRSENTVHPMKNEQGMLWPVPDYSATLLETYLQRYRPQLAASGNPYLFPNTRMGGRSPHDLAVGLTDKVEREIGCAFNMHLARHFAVALYLQHNPGQYEVARRILGHKKVKTTTDFYDGLGLDVAARQLDDNLDAQRSETRLIAAAAFQRGRGKPTKTSKAGLSR